MGDLKDGQEVETVSKQKLKVTVDKVGARVCARVHACPYQRTPPETR